MSKRKNKSKSIPSGRTFQTRDEYFYGQQNYRKPGYENNKVYYRRVVVVDSNSDNQLAVVKLTGNKGKIINNYQKGKSGYKPFVLTLDDKGNPIKKGFKFKENKQKYDISKTDVNNIRKDLFNNNKLHITEKNRKRVRMLKNRK